LEDSGGKIGGDFERVGEVDKLRLRVQEKLRFGLSEIVKDLESAREVEKLKL